MEDSTVLSRCANERGRKYPVGLMRNAVIVSLITVIAFCGTAGCAMTNSYGPYYGKVVDSETKEPIDGAAVLVVFYTEEYGPAGTIARYADAVETVTDKNGEFKIAAHRITTVRPLQGWSKHGYFTIFKPGYGCYPKHKHVKPMFVPNGTLPDNQDVAIQLPRLSNQEERLQNYGCYPSEQVPESKYPRLIGLIEIEREKVGLQPRQRPR